MRSMHIQSFVESSLGKGDRRITHPCRRAHLHRIEDHS